MVLENLSVAQLIAWHPHCWTTYFGCAITFFELLSGSWLRYVCILFVFGRRSGPYECHLKNGNTTRRQFMTSSHLDMSSYSNHMFSNISMSTRHVVLLVVVIMCTHHGAAGQLKDSKNNDVIHSTKRFVRRAAVAITLCMSKRDE